MEWARDVGVGLHVDDVEITEVTVKVVCKPCEGCGDPFYVDLDVSSAEMVLTDVLWIEGH